MAGSVSLTGADTIQIDDRILNDLADADSVKLTFPNDLAAVKASKDGNTIYAFNETGRTCEVELRVLLGSADDKYLNARLQEMKNAFSNFILATGTFSKRAGDGKGNVTTVVYQMAGGVFKKQVEAKTSSEGDTEQSVSVYTITFGNTGKSIQ
jgi:hypothetical protein